MRCIALQKAAISKEQLAGPLHGHITIATYLPDDAEFMRACTEIIRDTPAFPVRYEKLEVLSETSIIVAAPSKSAALMELHNRIAEKYGTSLDRWTRGTDWYPHTTLIHDPDTDQCAVCLKMRQHFIPFETRISQIEFSKVEGTGYTILETVDLKQ